MRFDNRDVGLSSKLDGVEPTRWPTWPLDAVAVLDAVGVERAHVMGLSMGGMIVQRLAIDHPDRLLHDDVGDVARRASPGYGDSAPEALAVLTAPPADDRATSTSTATSPRIAIYGSKPEWIEDGGPPGPRGRGLRPLLLPGGHRPPDAGRHRRRLAGRRPARR